MEIKTRNRIKLVSATVLLVSLGFTSLTGILKMPLLANSISDNLFQRLQKLPWGVLNFLHGWCGALALACVVVHLSLVWRRYLWVLNSVRKRED